MMGASFQASIAALFFNELLDILVSPGKLRTLQVCLVSGFYSLRYAVFHIEHHLIHGRIS